MRYCDCILSGSHNSHATRHVQGLAVWRGFCTTGNLLQGAVRAHAQDRWYPLQLQQHIARLTAVDSFVS